MSELRELRDISMTQVLGSGMVLREVFQEKFLNNIRKKLEDDYEDIIASDVRLMLIPKIRKPDLKEDDKGIIIQLRNADYLRIEQPSPDHYNDKTVVISSNRKGVLDKVLK